MVQVTQETQDEEKSDGDHASANSSTIFYLRSTILWPVSGGFEQEMEEVAALAEDAAKDFRDGEDELAVRDFVTDGGGDPFGALADAALVAGGTEVAALAGEGEEAFVAAIRAVEAEEASGKVAAAEEIAHDGGDIGAERPHGGTVAFFITGNEGVPGGGDDLPERRGTGAARL